MTYFPPPPAEPGSDRHEEPDRRRADRAATGRSRRSERNPRLELSAPIHSASRPFVWQHGSRLYLLVNEWRGWILAELEFVPSACHYVEVRRTSYEWPREAIGVLLSRALATDAATTRQLANDITAWLATLGTPVSIGIQELDA